MFRTKFYSKPFSHHKTTESTLSRNGAADRHVCNQTEVAVTIQENLSAIAKEHAGQGGEGGGESLGKMKEERKKEAKEGTKNVVENVILQCAVVKEMRDELFTTSS